MALEVPVLLIVFNRPDVTAQVLEALAKVRPRRLFVAADGPRSDSATDVELCRQTREVACNPDWKCEVVSLLQNENLGCGRGESAAMSWFFDHVEEGIILEDDCLPSSSFFDFCAYLLDKYRDHERVGSIGGNFFLPDMVQIGQPYYFSKYLQAWGWATWRRTWQHYRFDLSFLPDEEWDRICRENSATKVEESYWTFASRALAKGLIDTWDFQLLLICWKENLLHIAPATNLVRNIGFRPDATHTVLESPLGRLQAREMDDFRTDVDMSPLSEIDSVTFYVRFLDSLSSPWWLQQAIPLDEHLDWVAGQYRNLEQGTSALNAPISQSENQDLIQDFERFHHQVAEASQKLTASQEDLEGSNQRLAEAIQQFNQLKEGVDKLLSSSRYDRQLQQMLLQSVAGLQKGLRGFQMLVNRGRSLG